MARPGVPFRPGTMACSWIPRGARKGETRPALLRDLTLMRENETAFGTWPRSIRRIVACWFRESRQVCLVFLKWSIFSSVPSVYCRKIKFWWEKSTLLFLKIRISSDYIPFIIWLCNKSKKIPQIMLGCFYKHCTVRLKSVSPVTITIDNHYSEKSLNIQILFQNILTHRYVRI